MTKAAHIVRVLGLVAGLAASAAAAEPKAAGAAPYPVVQTIPANDVFWDYVTLIPDEKRLYVAREDGITVVDLRSGQVTPRFIAGEQVHAIVPLPGGRALMTQGKTGVATIFERATGRVIRNIAIGAKPDGAVLDRKSGLVIVCDGTRNELVFVNPRTGAIVGRVKLEGEPGAPLLDGRGHLFVNVTDHSETLSIDVAGRKVLHRYPLPSCEDASPLALDPEHQVLLAGCANMKVVALSAVTGKVLGTAPIAQYPDVIMFDPRRRVFYVPCVIPGTLVVVGEGQGGAPTVVASVPMAFGVHTGALDAEAGRLYLPAGDLRITPGARPTVAPGTFKIMVVDVTQGGAKPPG